MNAIVSGAIEGAKEGVVEFFQPTVSLVRGVCSALRWTATAVGVLPRPRSCSQARHKIA